LRTDDHEPTRPPLWIRAAVSDEAFAHEQACLGRQWSFVGFTSDIAKPGDWFRTIVGGKSIFIQRFEEGLRAFENRCAHRFYPLRTADHGNGPILCGFHHWRYNSDGVAMGIPKCQELFDTIPRAMDARLPQLDLDTCGDLIFVRLPSAAGTATLRDYLGGGYDILAASCQPRLPPRRFHQHVAAHWKFSHHISLDDYHVVAVHPKSFGRNGYFDNQDLQYHRFGVHSAYINTRAPDAFEAIRAACNAGTYVPSIYAIYNLFPNTLMSQFSAPDIFGTKHWYAVITRYMPVTRTSTEVQNWLFRLPHAYPEKPLSRLSRWSVDRILPPFVAHFARAIMKEDNAICEGQQRTATQVDGDPRLSRQELRIGWFEEAYAAALGEDS